MISTRLFRTILVATLIVLTVYFAQAIVMPIIFSALCAMFVHPLVKKLESWKINLVFSSLIVVILVTAILVGIFLLFLVEGLEIAQNLPISSPEQIVENPIRAVEDKLDLNIETTMPDINRYVNDAKDALIKAIPGTLLNLNSILIFFISCPIYIFFMLITRSSIHKFYYSCFEDSKKKFANRILQQIEMVYISYLKGMGYVVLIVAILTSLGLYLIGIPHAIFIGTLSGFLTLVPYVGVIIGALIPLAIALITKDSLWYAAMVIIVYAVVQFLEGNVITPKIMGNQVGLNPLLVIIGIVLFGAFAGIVGMVLTIPILALIKVVSFYIPGWKPLRYLLQTQ